MIRTAAVLCLFAAACAGAGKGGKSYQDRWKQTDYRAPESRVFQDDDERQRMKQAQDAVGRGQIAASSGNMDQARAEYLTAADLYAAFADRFQSNEYRIPIRYTAADLYLRSAQPEKAAMQAEKILVDPMAKDLSKAMAAHLAATAWQNAALQQQKAGKIEAIKLPTFEQRQGAPLQPKPAPAPWKRFIDATDNYLKVAAADPDLQKPVAERRFQMGPANLALTAAEVQYSSDNMEDAQKRFEQILANYANDPEVADPASLLYLQTFLLLKDQAGYQAAVAKVKGILQQQAQQAQDPKAKEAYTKAFENVQRLEQGSGFTDATRLMEQNKFADAAAAFEKFANEYRDNPDAPNALYNAGIAYDKAQQPEKAAAVREKILAQYADNQKVAAPAALMLGQYYSKKEKHVDAARQYEMYLSKWPQGDFKCVALQNVAYEFDVQNKRAEAADRYVAFGQDPKCAKEDPNSAAKTLFRAGQLFEKSKQRAKAKQAYTAAAAIEGVTDTVAKSQQAEAKRKAK